MATGKLPFSEETLAIAQLIRKQRQTLLGGFGNAPTRLKSKHGWDVVTDIDEKIEANLAAAIRRLDPGIAVYGEELGYKPGAERFWLIDPIDGTAAYSRGLPYATTMLARIEGGEVITAFIYDFVKDELYAAEKGKGAFCNNQRLRVSNRNLHGSVVSFETRLDNEKGRDRYARLDSKSWVVHFMSSGYEFAMVAAGRLEARIVENGFGFDWDFAPGSLLVAEAGGIVRNLYSSTYKYTNHDFIAANPIVYKELTTGTGAVFEKR